MTARYASFLIDGAASYGVIDGDAIADCGAVLRPDLPTLRAAIAADALPRVAAAAAQAPRHPLAAVTLAPVIPDPGKILCVGLNYETHRQETGRREVANPTIFARYANSQIGHGATLQLPHVSEQFDYEGELAVIIGRPGRYIAEADAMAHVAGYSIYMDGSLRDFQLHTHQYTPGKNFVGTGPFGPWMITPDAMGPLGPQSIRTTLNDRVVQDAHLSDMIFSVARIIEYCSSFTRLEPGDVIATGTPGGVGSKRTPPLWMKLGDTVSVSIEGIGTLTNKVGPEVLG